MLYTRADHPRATLILAHGSAVAMDHPIMASLAERLAARGLNVVRFNFPYMAESVARGTKRPPPAADRLINPYEEVIAALDQDVCAVPLLVGGKSLGGRVASLLAAERTRAIDTTLAGTARSQFEGPPLRGVICFGYPFHPPRKPEVLRTAHLASISCPVLIVQGTHDPFGTRDEVATYTLAPTVSISWIETGDHDLKPLKSSGLSHDEALDAAADAAATFLPTLPAG
ncbi:MAG: alpha/beta family hydrolase [Pseudomonadota bacterium]